MARPLRLLVDARMLLGRFSGVARFVTELVEALVRQPGIQVAVLCGNEPFQPWATRSDVRAVFSSFGPKDRTPSRRLWWEEVQLAQFIRHAKVDVFHATWNSGIPARCPVPAVLTLHDLIPWHNPRPYFATILQRICFRHAIRSAVRRAALVTTVSEHVKQDALATLRAKPKSIVVVPNGVRSTLNPPTTGLTELNPPLPEQNRNSDSCYALYVGGHEQRKNLTALFEALQAYWDQFDANLELRLTGLPESLDEAAWAAYEGLRYKNKVRFLGSLTDAQLEAQYASAGILLLLSHAEGFGLPVLEAMARGCPVIAADRAALPEVVADAGILVNPDDVQLVAGAMRTVLTDAPRRRALIQRGLDRASAFHWDTIATRMRDLYENARSIT